MRNRDRLRIVVILLSAPLALFLIWLMYWRWKSSRRRVALEARGEELEDEILLNFREREDLTVHDILDAPGEVIGKSSYSTLYRATLIRMKSAVVLRFLRPACTGRMNEITPVIQLLGFIRHPNLVALEAFYSGTRGEKLLVHPFYNGGTLSDFIRDGKEDSKRWSIIYKITFGIASGMFHLHSGLYKPIIHGNIKSRNVLLDSNYQAYMSDFGLHLLLNAASAQEMLESSADGGYKAPELIKMREATMESDIYSLGVVFLEMLTGKEPINGDPSSLKSCYLPALVRTALLDDRVMELVRPVLSTGGDRHKGQMTITEQGVIAFFQLAMSCCSPSPSLRPDIKQVMTKLEEIGHGK